MISGKNVKKVKKNFNFNMQCPSAWGPRIFFIFKPAAPATVKCPFFNNETYALGKKKLPAKF